MEQHPVPQNISSYQFRLVGDMTLKQFFELAGGALLSLLFYASSLHPLIKWPLIIFFSTMGVALAFLPLQERPLERWIFSFFKSIYSPTIYTWKKGEPSNFFQDEVLGTARQEPTLPKEKIVTPLSKLEDAEKSFLSRITGLFGNFGGVPVQPPLPESVAPTAQKLPEAEVTPPPLPPMPQSAPQAQVDRVLTPAPEIQTPTVAVAPTLSGQKTASAGAPQFSQGAAPPNPPESPNLITGQIVDREGKIVENAIIEIRDSVGHPVRALKSNKLGHFMIVTPLLNGRYEMLTEKEGYDFEPIAFDASGSIIPPISIVAKPLAGVNLGASQTN